MIVIRNKGKVLDGGAVHVFAWRGGKGPAPSLCGVKADFVPSHMLTLAEDVMSDEGARRAIERFRRSRDRCERCAAWLEKNWEALVAAERLASTR